MKPRVFVGSSTEGLDVAKNLILSLSADCETVPWCAGVFGVSETYIESLEKALSNVEFAVLVVTADDDREKRGIEGKIPRDNVVFELGLFMGRLGRERTFIVRDPGANVELPTDLLGISVAEFDSNRSDRNLEIALLPAATRIVHAIRQLPRLTTAQADKSAYDALPDADTLYGAIVSWPVDEGHEIVVQSADTRWAWNLVPTLIHWQMNGVVVRVFAPPLGQQGAREEVARRNLLADLGIELRETPSLDFSGFFLKTKYPEDDVAIVINGQEGGAPLATRYEGSANASAIEALHRKLPPPDSKGAAERFAPTLVAQDPAEICQMLRKGVKQYRSPKVQLEVAAFPTKGLMLMSPYARGYKYKQIERLFHAYASNKHDPFTALAVQLRAGRKSILTPPVVEDRPDGPVVIEGTTRAAYCFKQGIKDYRCIVARGVDDALPGVPVPVSSVTTSERSLSLGERTEGYQSLLYRHIERATHPY
jgi:hypothetical protein